MFKGIYTKLLTLILIISEHNYLGCLSIFCFSTMNLNCLDNKGNASHKDLWE